MPINLFKKKDNAQNNIKVENNKDMQDNKTTLLSKDHSTKNLNQESLKIVDIEAKEKHIKKRKRRFKLIQSVFLLSLFIMICTPLGIRIYKQYFLKPDPIPQPPIDDNNKPPIDVLDPESIVEYQNDGLKLSLEHLRKASLFENTNQTDQTKKTEIIYDKNNPNQNVSLGDLTEGYIFRISAFSTSFRNIDEISRVKKEAFAATCPSTAEITNIIGVNVGGIEGRSFEVFNCGADYKVSYVVKNGLNYEFAQIFKGNIGYRQLYKAETENILRSISFYPEEKPDLGPIEIYDSTEHKVYFEYPRSLDKECCYVSGPISDRSTILLTLANPETYVDNNNLDVVGFFIDQNNLDNFDAYIEKQKKLLTDDYIVTKGESPKPEIRTVEIGDKEGTMLRGYSWKGNDLIYVDISKEGGAKKILVISTKNISGEKFENVVNSIFDSFKYY